MKVQTLIRQSHRWISMLFVLAVIAATLAAATGQDTASLLYYLPLPPLFLLMGTGLYMFVFSLCGSLAEPSDCRTGLMR